jgi:hypothetical protein
MLFPEYGVDYEKKESSSSSFMALSQNKDRLHNIIVHARKVGPK